MDFTEWVELTPPISASTDTAVAFDASANNTAQRFYRVVELP